CASLANGTIEVMVERGDEPWDSANPFYLMVLGDIARTNLYDYYPNGTVVSSYLTTNSAAPLSNFGFYGLGAHTVFSAHTYQLFKDAFVAAGGNASQVKHILGAQWEYAVPAQIELAAAQTWYPGRLRGARALHQHAARDDGHQRLQRLRRQPEPGGHQ